MGTINTMAQPLAAPASIAAAPYDPFGGLKREIATIVTESAGDAFQQQQPLIRRTIGDAIQDQQPAIQQAVERAIEGQLPLIRTELDSLVDDSLTRVKAELPVVLDAEVKRQRAVIEAEVRPLVTQQVDSVKQIATSAITGGGIGAVGGGLLGFALGAKAWGGGAGGLLGAAGLAALGATAGVLIGGWSGASTVGADA